MFASRSVRLILFQRRQFVLLKLLGPSFVTPQLAWWCAPVGTLCGGSAIVLWLNGGQRCVICCQSDDHDSILVFLSDFPGLEQLSIEQDPQSRLQGYRQFYN